MKPDLYTKAILTVVALMLTVIACKPLISPETTASAQGRLPPCSLQGSAAIYSFSMPALAKCGIIPVTTAR
jgi:hypothetical protein